MFVALDFRGPGFQPLSESRTTNPTLDPLHFSPEALRRIAPLYSHSAKPEEEEHKRMRYAQPRPIATTSGNAFTSSTSQHSHVWTPSASDYEAEQYFAGRSGMGMGDGSSFEEGLTGGLYGAGGFTSLGFDHFGLGYTVGPRSPHGSNAPERRRLNNILRLPILNGSASFQRVGIDPSVHGQSQISSTSGGVGNRDPSRNPGVLQGSDVPSSGALNDGPGGVATELISTLINSSGEREGKIGYIHGDGVVRPMDGEFDVVLRRSTPYAVCGEVGDGNCLFRCLARQVCPIIRAYL